MKNKELQNLDKLKEMRHSGAHLLAYAVKTLFPNAKLAIGPAIDDGFYYDFGDIKIQEDDLVRIENKMKELQKKDYTFEKIEMSIEDAEKFLKKEDEIYSLSLLKDIKEKGSTIKEEMDNNNKKNETDIVTFYKSGEFINLCRGGHVDSFKNIGPFKLTSIAGAYFRGDEKNPMLTRIYAACFETFDELENYLKEREEAKERDHRNIGEKLGIFLLSENIGQGLPILLPSGETIKHLLIEYMRKKEERLGYKYIATPHITQALLYEESGHATHYSEDMYSFKDKEGNIFYIKPMSCPHHHMVYKKITQSYRDLPLKLAEAAAVYRYERSGTLTGLIRIRGPITQNDAHIYTPKDELESEFLKVLSLFKEVYSELNIKGYWYRLSLPDFDKDKYEGEKEMWQYATEKIQNSLKKSKNNYTVGIGEAAFYGPKLDVQIKNIFGKEDTIATIQIDILQPKRMSLTFINQNGEKETPIVIHRSILGSYERFIAFFLEQTFVSFIYIHSSS